MVRRARMRKAYFKMVEEDGGDPGPKPWLKPDENAENFSTDSEDERENPGPKEKRERPAPGPHLTKKQLAKQKRQEAYHKQKELEEARAKAEKKRQHKKGTIQKRTSKGQPKLGSRMGLLLEKLKQEQSD